MSDLFHPDVPVDFISQVWSVMAETSRHDYQLLTKRPDRMREILSSARFKVLPNVWIGTSVEGPEVVDRIEHLRATPAAVRFISFEPLIGPIHDVNLEGIAWAIVGGESGPAARMMDEQWVWAIERLCRRYDSAFFFKQWGGVNKKATGRLLGGRTYDEMPAHISL